MHALFTYARLQTHARTLFLALCVYPSRSLTRSLSLIHVLAHARTRALLMNARARTHADPRIAFDGSEEKRSVVEPGIT